mgnify:FL=1|jgi:hypothetical protein|tara:strand:+ start:405 stop:881 length:477 start_codon:yes stop_codon:yes gene_type:complete
MQYRSKESLEYIKKMKPIWDEKYLNSEKGFFKELWHSIKRRCDKNSGYHKLNKRTVQVNNGIKGRDHLLELWEKQKKLLGGPYCIYTGIKLTTKRIRGKGYSGSTLTNISIDRIDSTLPYQENNIVFCSWEFNDRKAAVTISDCKKILKVWEEHRAGN